MRHSSFLTQVGLAFLLLVVGLVAPMRETSAAGRWAPGPEPRVHVVAAGETLSTIAPRYGVTVAEIVAANRLKSADLIQIGQRLVIPAAGVEQIPTTGKNPGAMAPVVYETYRPKPGDTLGSIARQFKVSPQTLLEANSADRPSELLECAEIRVPVLQLPDVPAPFVLVEYSGPIIQGRSGVARVTLDQPLLPSGTFGNTVLTFAFERKTSLGHRYWALLPTNAITPLGERALTARVGDAQVVQPVKVVSGAYETQHIVLPAGKGDLLAPARTQPEIKRLMALWTTPSNQQQWQGAFRFPIADGFQQTSPYGTRRSYNGGPVSSFHEGTDWGAPEGTPVIAPAAGTVVLAEPLDVRGGAVIIDHGLGVTSNFWHLSRIDVKPGEQVKSGQTIGLVGTTGLSTAAHLHWEMRIGGVAVEPRQWSRVNFPYVGEAPTQ